jgi:ubiquinone biosynthesis accessory factor UbiJ
MATQSPFSWFETFLQEFKLPLTPPAWAIEESQRRMVLLVNHVLMQEPQAASRLARQAGRHVRVQWGPLVFPITITPAGLLDLTADQVDADLTLTLTETSPWPLVQALLQGDKPAVRVEGDVQLAGEVNWLIDHVRWDIEADLARLLGDVPAHLIAQNCRNVAQALRSFVGRRASAAKTGATSEGRA